MPHRTCPNKVDDATAVTIMHGWYWDVTYDVQPFIWLALQEELAAYDPDDLEITPTWWDIWEEGPKRDRRPASYSVIAR